MRSSVVVLKFAYLLAVAITTVLCVSQDAHADPRHPWRFGVYEGAGCDGVNGIAKFQAWSGKDTVGRAIDGLQNDTWPNMITEASWMLGCWPKSVDLIISVPMLTTGGVSTLALGAAGNYDTYFSQLAALFVKAGRGNAVIRLGWEFNGSWFPWAAANDPVNFIADWKRIVATMRAVPGAHFQFDWCAGSGWDAKPADTYYPGDDYVDIIGLDVYDQWWNAAEQNSPQTRWSDLLTTTYGLNWQKTFATVHGKEISFPEWGSGTRPDGHGAGDDPYFIQQMLAWQHESTNAALNYADYWDYPAKDYNAKLSDNHQPMSGLAFLQYWNWSAPQLSAVKAIANVAAPKS